jgi:hypothetical protein
MEMLRAIDLKVLLIMTCQFMTNKKEKINENPPVIGGPF